MLVGLFGKKALMLYARSLAVIALSLCVAASALAKGPLKLESLPMPAEAVSAEARIHPVNMVADGRKEIVIVRKDTVTIYRFDATGYQKHQEIVLPASAKSSGKLYYSFARFQPHGTYQLVLLTPDGILVYPLNGDRIADEPVLLLKKQLIQGGTSGAPVQYFDFALDLNNDELDDFLVPESNGFSIYRQSAPQKLELVKLPRNPYEHKSMFSFSQDVPEDSARIPAISASISYRKGVDNVLFFDANGDGFQDLIYTSTRHGPKSKEVERYDVFLQEPGLTFSSKASQSIEVPYETNSDVTFRDLNQDKRLDAIIVKSNMDIVNPRTVVRFYIAGKQAYQLFEKETDRFLTKDPIGLVMVNDFNGDSMTDFAMTFFSYQFGSAEDIVDLALASKVRFKLQFFLGQGTRGYNRTPTAEKELVLNIRDTTFNGEPIMMVDDINGDKLMDLIVRPDRETLEVYASEGPAVFPKGPAAKLDIAEDAEVAYEDMNSDGLTDLIIYSATKKDLRIHFATVD